LPELWKKIQTDLVERQGRKISDSIRPGSHALRYVQGLIIEEVLDRDMVAVSLHKLIFAMPCGQLRRIYLANVVRPATLLLLLHLDFTGQDACKHVLSSTPFDQCLSQIKAVRAGIESDSTELIQTLFAKCPKLHRITFGSRIDTDSTIPLLSEETFGNGEAPSTMTVFELKRLVFYTVRLPKTVASLFQRIDIIALRKLTIEDCPAQGLSGYSRL
jgi:hypothetical protein